MVGAGINSYFRCDIHLTFTTITLIVKLTCTVSMICFTAISQCATYQFILEQDPLQQLRFICRLTECISVKLYDSSEG